MYNLRDILLFSPKALKFNYEKILWIFYQLLNLIKNLHDNNLNCGNITIRDLYLDELNNLKIILPLSSILEIYTNEFEDQNETLNHKETFLFRQNLFDVYSSYCNLTYEKLSQATYDWSFGKISNFDYLLMINALSGKRLNCPFNHPIFPWISNFDSPTGTLRDLCYSKYRLNKGDDHLDYTYKESMNEHGNGYHLTEYLSEITYFVYKSRITDKETLCQHVRNKWVPNEYPVNMKRLYDWTPEECIPEFYCDPDIFKSTHEDMNDLGLPEWCSSREEFIRTHRDLLESDQVSYQLHNWIDLVFGFKLSGEAAIQSKNVFLSMIDKNEEYRSSGIVKLFTVPHPRKILSKSLSINEGSGLKEMKNNVSTNSLNSLQEKK